MNLLTIGLIAGGVYLFTQTKKKSKLVNTRLPKDLFHNYAYDFFAWTPIDINSKGELYKTYTYTKDLQNLTDFDPPLPLKEINANFIKFLGIKQWSINLQTKKENPDKTLEGLKWLYDRNHKLINEVYREYLISLMNNSPDKNKIIEVLPYTFENYFQMLKDAGISQNKWPSKELGF